MSENCVENFELKQITMEVANVRFVEDLQSLATRKEIQLIRIDPVTIDDKYLDEHCKNLVLDEVHKEAAQVKIEEQVFYKFNWNKKLSSFIFGKSGYIRN